MNRGAKLALAFGGAFVAVGAIVLVAAKDAKASPAPDVKPPLPLPDGSETPPGEGVVVVPENAPDEPAAPPVVVPQPSPLSAEEMGDVNRLLLRWWSTEGADFPPDEMPPATPRDFGSLPGDLGANFGARNADAAIAFCQGNCNSATLDPLVKNRVASKALLAALRAWDKQRQMPAAQQGGSASSPAPIIVTPPGSSEPVVVAPDTTSPLPPFVPLPPAPAAFPLPTLPPAAGPPPFVPPLPQAAPPAPPASSPPFGIPPPAPSAGTGPFGIPVPAAPPVVAPAPVPQQGPPVLTVPPSVPSATPAPASTAEQPSMVPADTAALVQALLAAEATDKWKRVDPAVTVWQKSRGLKQDGKFGPKSALEVAKEVGTVPIVRFWPAGSQQAKAVQEYRVALLELAQLAPEPRASQLKMAAAREQGQAFGSKQSALPPSQRVLLGAA